MRYVLTLLTCCTMLFGVAQQNLVTDPGFEIMNACPTQWTTNAGRSDIAYWNYPSQGTTDYFHRCSQRSGVPKNWAGNRKARGGEAYAGFSSIQIRKNNIEKNYREYLQTRLKQKLTAGQLYCVKFYVGLAQNSFYASDGVGAYLSTLRLNSDTVVVLDYQPQIKNPAGRIIKMSDTWTQVCGTFKARGDEQFLVIGNFNPLKTTRTRLSGTTPFNAMLSTAAYYYIDDVSVYAIKDDQECGCVQESQDDRLTTGNEVVFSSENIESNLEVGKAIKLDHVFFDTDKSDLLKESFLQLDKLVELLSRKVEISVEISGHTDSTGTEERNKVLSRERARSVYNYLVSQKISDSRLSYKGYGSTRPVAANGNESGRQKNRRVEFTILDR